MDHFRKDIKSIYSHIGNAVSKQIFIDRLMYNITDDIRFIKNIIGTTVEGKEFLDRIQCNKKKLIFGAGIWGKEILDTYRGVPFECFVDNKAAGKIYEGLPVISFDEYMEKYKNEIIVISSRLYHKEIYQQLKENGVSDDNIVNAGKITDIMSRRQYFDIPEFNNEMEEGCFVDAGSFDGRTSKIFAEWCEGRFQKIFAFEPDSKNAVKCEDTLRNCVGGGKNSVIRKGLWDKEDVLCFKAYSNGASRVEKKGEIKIPVGRLDDMIRDERVTFIKMDIEGSEYNALLGARETIVRNRPKLAVSIYHKKEDVWTIPSLILEMVSDYELYFGHYSIAAAETVLYAI